MDDRLLTCSTLTASGPRLGVTDLRRLERSLEDRIAGLDTRVDALLAFDGPPTDADIAAIDVACAAIGELSELLEVVRTESGADRARWA